MGMSHQRWPEAFPRFHSQGPPLDLAQSAPATPSVPPLPPPLAAALPFTAITVTRSLPAGSTPDQQPVARRLRIESPTSSGEEEEEEEMDGDQPGPSTPYRPMRSRYQRTPSPARPLRSSGPSSYGGAASSAGGSGSGYRGDRESRGGFYDSRPSVGARTGGQSTSASGYMGRRAGAGSGDPEPGRTSFRDSEGSRRADARGDAERGGSFYDSTDGGAVTRVSPSRVRAARSPSSRLERLGLTPLGTQFTV